MSAISNPTTWKVSNLAAITQRLEPLLSVSKIEEIIQGDIQGIFLHKVGDQLKMYCYDNSTQKLSNIMSRIDLVNPLNLIGPYSQAVFLSAFWQTKEPDNIYIAGFGGGRLAMLFHHYFPQIDIHGTDIDPNVLTVAKDFFGLSSDVLENIKIGDSREDLSARKVLYDIIFLDVFVGSGEHANHLATTEFFQLCKEKLTEHGIIVANLVIIDEQMHRKIAAMQAAFAHCYVWEFNGAHVLFASNNAIDLEQFCSRVAEFESAEKPGFNLLEKATMLEPSIARKDIQALSDKDL